MIGEELMLTIRAIAERKGLPCIIGHKDLEEQLNAKKALAKVSQAVAVPGYRMAETRSRRAHVRKHGVESRGNLVER